MTAVILFAAFAVSAQMYSVPKELNIEKVVEKNFPIYYGHEYPQLIAEKFFPIGWSRDGKFAYYVEPVDEACGCYFAALVIQDLRTDKILWEFKYNQGKETDDEGNMPPEDSIEKLWAKNQKLFSQKLKENGIQATSGLKLLGNKFANGGRSYTASVEKVFANDDDGTPRIKKVSTFLSSSKLGKKNIYSESFEPDLFAAPLNAAAVGALKSPFENRTAIILIVVRRGWEGPPHTADVRIVGADLLKGFGKK